MQPQKLFGDIKEMCCNFRIVVLDDGDVADAVLVCYMRNVLIFLPRVYLSLSRICCKQGQPSDAIVYASLGLDWSNHFRCQNKLARPLVHMIDLLLAHPCGHTNIGDFISGIHYYDSAWAAAQSIGDGFENTNEFILGKALQT